jgi:hypothetical protein
MTSHYRSAMEDLQLPVPGEHIHRLADQSEGDGVSVALEAHQVIVRDDAAGRHTGL